MAQDIPFFCDFCKKQFTTSDTIFIRRPEGKRMDICQKCKDTINDARDKAHLPRI